jgi:hypothetical protein
MGFKVTVIRPGPLGLPSDRYATELSIEEVMKISDKVTHLDFRSGNGPETLNVGDVLPSRVGGRLIVRTWWDGQQPKIAFYENGKIFEQNAIWFLSDSWIEAFQTGAFWARGGATIAQIQVAFCLGMMGAGLGAVSNFALTAINIMEFATSDEFRALKHALPYLLEARDIMQEHYPTLYDAVFAVLFEAWKGSAAKALTMMAVAQLAGRFVGRFGRAESKILLKLIKDLVMYSGFFTVVHALRMAGQAVKPDALKDALAKAGKSISLADAAKIAAEIQKTDKKTFDDLKKLFEKASNPYADEE